MTDNRPSWDEYFVKIANLTKTRSNCMKRMVGCIIVKDTRILSLGYNGTPRGYMNCFDGGCKRCMEISQSGNHLDICMCLHAEENAIMYPSQTELEGSTLYVTLHPCIGCVKKIIQCKIKKVVFSEYYSPELDKMSNKILLESGIEVVYIKN